MSSNLNFNNSESASENRDRWKDLRECLSKEREEIESELERQRLLDQLSASRSRNHELETALAQLAREQDRLSLIERERVLKRAQIAQATSVLVQEANWAKNRMEAEMKLAKQRAMMFPETVAPGSMSINSRTDLGSRNTGHDPFRVPVSKIPAAPPWNGSVPVPLPGPSASANLPAAPSSETAAPENNTTPPRILSFASPADSIQKPFQQLPASGIIEAAVDILPNPGFVGEVISNTYSSVITSFFEQKPAAPVIDTSPVAESRENVVTNTTSISNIPSAIPDHDPHSTVDPVEEVPSNLKEEQPVLLPVAPNTEIPMQVEEVSENDELHAVKPVPVSGPNLEIQQNTFSGSASKLPPPHPSLENPQSMPKQIPKIASVIMPERTPLRLNESTKVINPVARGEWTRSELHDQASSVLSQLIQERDIIMLSKPFLMASFFGLPLREIRKPEALENPAEWTQAADEWARSGGFPDRNTTKTRKAGQNTQIDPSIAVLAGVGPDMNDLNRPFPDSRGDKSSVDGEKKAGDVKASDESNNLSKDSPIVESDKLENETSGEKRKSKKGCQIM